MGTYDGPGDGAAGYTDQEFERVTDDIEELLADLMGIESVARYVREQNLPTDTGEEGGAGPAPYTYAMPTRRSFTVWPTLPSIGYDEWKPHLDAAFAVGKGQAAGIGAWLRGCLVQHLYGVDAQSLIRAARAQQAELGTTKRGLLVDCFADVQVLMDNHWTGGASTEFEVWSNEVGPVVHALLNYAAAAQMAAGGTGDIIAAGQKTMLRQATNARQGLEDALAAWVEDADVFPFPPGSGYKLSDLMMATRDAAVDYADQFPGGGVLLAELVGSKEYAGTFDVAFTYTYDALQKAESGDSSPKTPKTAQEFVDDLEAALTKIAKHATDAMTDIGDRLKPLAEEINDKQVLRLDAIPNAEDPGGRYA
ncbi:hypothetical protein [Nocardioides speluncae]|uniref:hypothetical protein n=1 Tax=Nocardioides speluncae TaxID=2670337 RepID=UPI000D695DF6|nr:hypothetical protein [Nocardioides speluncae]